MPPSKPPLALFGGPLDEPRRHHAGPAAARPRLPMVPDDTLEAAAGVDWGPRPEPKLPRPTKGCSPSGDKPRKGRPR
jgi:hypothetical protein